MAKVDVIVVDDSAADGVVCVTRDGRVLGQSGAVAASDVPKLVSEALDASRRGEEVRVLDTAELAERLQEALALARQHFDHDITADYIADVDGKLLAVNPVFLRTFGFETESQALARELSALFPSRAAWTGFLEVLQDNARLRRHRVELRTLQGEVVHAVQNVFLDLDEAGRPWRIRGYVLDRTSERLLEEQLSRWQRLEAVGRLAGGVAHDFNNLLTVILSYAQLLEKQLPEGSLPREMVGEMFHAGERAADLTRRLLAFGRRQSLRAVPVDVNELVERMVPLVNSVTGALIEVELLLGTNLGSVSGDAGQIEQVLMNLIVNARDAMPDGGKLTIETEMVLIDAEYRKSHPWASIGRYALISITDTGSGMAQDVLDHVFEPFFTTKESGSGTGLGLASAYGIVKQHGGMIHAYSEEEVGTTVKVYLPIATRPAGAVGPKLRRRTAGGSETVLVAEDEPSVRAVLVHCLRERGYRVLEAASGEQALELFRDDPDVAIAVLDVVMPGIGGVATYERLRKLRPSLPIILTSGYSGELASEQFAEDPQAHFLPKPYAPDAILDRVRRALDAALSDVG